MPLEIGKAVDTELARIEAEKENALDAEVTTDGVAAEVSHAQGSWRVAAYVKKVWRGPWTGGAKVRKEW